MIKLLLKKMVLTTDSFAGGWSVCCDKAYSATEGIIFDERAASFGRSRDDQAVIARRLFSIRTVATTETALKKF